MTIGLEFIHEGTQDAAIRRMAFDYASDDAIPALSPSPIDLAAYRDVVLERFANPAIRDGNARVAMDGFSKIPGFIVPTFRDRLGQGHSVDSVALLPALFLAYLQRWHAGLMPAYRDQAMDPAVAHAMCSAPDPVLALCQDKALWGDLTGDERVLTALRGATARVQSFLQARGHSHG